MSWNILKQIFGTSNGQKMDDEIDAAPKALLAKLGIAPTSAAVIAKLDSLVASAVAELKTLEGQALTEIEQSDLLAFFEKVISNLKV